MNSLKEIIDNIFENEKLWVYPYYKPQEDIYNQAECKDFIRNYMQSAGSDSDFNAFLKVLNKPDAIEDYRYQHIVFTFFLGLAIYTNCDIIRNKIDVAFCDSDVYKPALELHKDSPFAYLWFLICLFHDLGYQYESNNKDNKKNEATFTSVVSEVTKGGVPSLLSKLDGIPHHYTPQLIESYFNYRRDIRKKFDHGICGGLHMFETLCSIRRKRKEELNPADKSGKWIDELELIFSLASSIVLCHNIFLPDEKSYGEYKKYQMEELIAFAEAVKEKQYPYRMGDFPIFFLFCLVDSIEPIKIIKDPMLLTYIIHRG